MKQIQFPIPHEYRQRKQWKLYQSDWDEQTVISLEKIKNLKNHFNPIQTSETIAICLK